jgi:hypothetical protein
MRVRIVKAAEGIVDGVSVGHLIPGLTYDVPASVAHYLITKRCAEEVPLTRSALVVPLDNARAYEQLTRGVSVVLPRRQPSNRPPRRRKR